MIVTWPNAVPRELIFTPMSSILSSLETSVRSYVTLSDVMLEELKSTNHGSKPN